MKKYSSIVYLLLLAAALSGCRQMEEAPISQSEETTWTLTVRASRSGDDTKGLAIGDGESEASTTALLSIWKEGEPVYVYKGETQIGCLTAMPDLTDAHYATLSGSVTTSGISAGTTRLSLHTPSGNWTYTGQEGSLMGSVNSIESKYNFARADDVLVTEVDGNGITTAPASFANQQSIYRLSFRFQKNGVGDKTPINARRITLSAANGGLWRNATEGTGPLTVTLPSATADPFFVALRNLNTTDAETLHFQVIDDGGITYLGNKTIPAAYKPNGTFVSIKNATLTNRLSVPFSTETVENAL